MSSNQNPASDPFRVAGLGDPEFLAELAAIADPTGMEAEAAEIEAEAPKGECSICEKPVVFIHDMWIGVDGNERCADGGIHDTGA